MTTTTAMDDDGDDGDGDDDDGGGALPDTGGQSLWILLMGGLLTGPRYRDPLQPRIDGSRSDCRTGSAGRARDALVVHDQVAHADLPVTVGEA